MDPVTTILTLPVGGPLRALTWLARQIANAATQQLLDPTRIEAALIALERRLEDGQIDEATFEAEEALLLEELAEIGELRAAEARAASEEPDAEPDAEPDSVSEAAPDPVEADAPDTVAREADEWTLA